MQWEDLDSDTAVQYWFSTSLMKRQIVKLTVHLKSHSLNNYFTIFITATYLTPLTKLSTEKNWTLPNSRQTVRLITFPSQASHVTGQQSNPFTIINYLPFSGMFFSSRNNETKYKQTNNFFYMFIVGCLQCHLR